MESDIPENIKAYLQPFIDRVEALEKKNEVLEAEVKALQPKTHPEPKSSIKNSSHVNGTCYFTQLNQ